MRFYPHETEPATLIAGLSPENSEVIKAAYTDKICRLLVDVEEGSDLSDEIDGYVDFALLEDEEDLIVNTEDIQGIRDVLIEFGTHTVDTVREQARLRYEGHYYSAYRIPERIKLGRAALRMARELAVETPVLEGSDNGIERTGESAVEETANEAIGQLPPHTE